MRCSGAPIELTSGVDSLYLSARGVIPEPLLDDLETVKADARDRGEPIDAELGGYPVRVRGSGWGNYAYCVTHELARIGLTRSENFPAVRVQPTALAIHALGPETTVLWVRNLLDAANIDATVHVSRLDLHADWQHFDLAADERSNFVTYSNRRALYEVDDELSGLNFGTRGGSLYARIYDKTRELEQKGDDWWPDIWGPSYDPDEPVTRIEFEFTREGLGQFGIDSPEDAFDQLGPLWAYATGHWLSLRIPTGDETRSRRPIDPRWAVIQRATLAGDALPADRIRSSQKAGSLRRIMPQLVGLLTSAAVHLDTRGPNATWDALAPHIATYGHQTGIDFDQRADTKRRQA